MNVWNSALERKLLTQIDAPIFGWNYTYQLPADCIKVVEVEPVSRFQVEKKNILSNETSLYLLYVATPTDTNNLDSLLAEAIAMKLAVEIAESLTSKEGLKKEMAQILMLKKVGTQLHTAHLILLLLVTKLINKHGKLNEV